MKKGTILYFIVMNVVLFMLGMSLVIPILKREEDVEIEEWEKAAKKA